MTKLIFWLVLVLPSAYGFSQTISGNLSLLPNQSIQLEGFNGLKTYRAVV